MTRKGILVAALVTNEMRATLASVISVAFMVIVGTGALFEVCATLAEHSGCCNQVSEINCTGRTVAQLEIRLVQAAIEVDQREKNGGCGRWFLR